MSSMVCCEGTVVAVLAGTPPVLNPVTDRQMWSGFYGYNSTYMYVYPYVHMSTCLNRNGWFWAWGSVLKQLEHRKQSEHVSHLWHVTVKMFIIMKQDCNCIHIERSCIVYVQYWKATKFICTCICTMSYLKHFPLIGHTLQLLQVMPRWWTSLVTATRLPLLVFFNLCNSSYSSCIIWDIPCICIPIIHYCMWILYLKSWKFFSA